MTPNNNIDEMVRMAMEKGAINYDDSGRFCCPMPCLRA